MAKSDSNSIITPFGAEEKTAEAPTSTDAIVGFLQDGALPLVAGLIVAVFLLYQFGRWFLTQGAMSEPAVLSEAPVAEVQPPEEQAPEEVEALRASRPWHNKS